jgi:hypothetical protein
MSFKFQGVSGEFVFENDLYLKDLVTSLYLRNDLVISHIEAHIAEKFWWKFEDGKVKSVYGDVVLGGDDEEDVPVNRAAALIEEALNAKAKSCDCQCGCGPDCQGCDCDCGCPKKAEPEEAEPEEAEPEEAEPEEAEPEEAEPEEAEPEEAEPEEAESEEEVPELKQ